MLLRRLFAGFCQNKLNAEKYIRAASQQALLFKPPLLRQLTVEEAKVNRIVKQFFEKYAEQVSIREAQKRLDEVKMSTPTHSYMEITIPFQTFPEIRNKFLRFYTNTVRGGRVLEIMDYMAANVGYRYCLPASSKQQADNFSIVTASVDHINFFRPILSDLNCTFSAYATYAGSSSIEVQVNVQQKKGTEELLNCTATFLMVARDKQRGGKHNVPPMDLSKESEICKMRYQFGVDRQRIRKEAAKRSLTYASPCAEESHLLHDIFLKLKTIKVESDSIPLSSTRMHKTLLMHLQDRNLHGKVFGGYLMREAFELGWLCAYMFVKGASMPEIYFIDDIQFIQAVEIGSAVEFTAVVAYTESNFVHVTVTCDKIQPTGVRSRTNILKLCFSCNQEVKPVHPITYDDAMIYLESRRITSQGNMIY